MRFKASTDYGMRAVLYLAAHDDTCSSRDIAEDMDIPRDYLIQLAQMLRNAGLIEARPGKNGGYRLAKPASEISVLSVVEALRDANHPATRAGRTSKPQRNDGDLVVGLKQAYSLFEDSVDAYLNSLTIDMLLSCSADPKNSARFMADRLQEESKRISESC